MKGTSKLVKYYLKEEYPGKLETPTASELVERVKSKYGLIVSYLMALRGKHSAESEIRGDPCDHYRRLPKWLHMLIKRNLGTHASLSLDDDGRFKYVFIALSAAIKGRKYLRKVVAIDATFLIGSYKGALVVATAQDGDHHQYPLAWGIIDREKDASWTWFMERLKDAVPDGPDVVVLSDRHGTIIKAVREVYKEADHDFCTVEWFNRHRMEAGSTDDSHKLTPFIDKVFHERYEITCTYEVIVLNSSMDEFESRNRSSPQDWQRQYYTGLMLSILSPGDMAVGLSRNGLSGS
ncbi:PREDICTED: uncharacterized protein LOC104824661 [Tarenaya hassleriana]|uniref:uncharacterized protein LOC104824661 n=1 Tax=Tarenaya hassleriana TaxID=28532 RepID=UPI00053C193C|nr:PREDICTED: uncharacterized protein LOC104824661 [Tarenaya hassleriana]